MRRTGSTGAASCAPPASPLEAAAGILAVEAYHAGLIRTVLLAKGLEQEANKISDARDGLDGLDGAADLDQGIEVRNRANVVPADGNGIAFGRSPGQVLNIVYLDPGRATKGGFFRTGSTARSTPARAEPVDRRTGGTRARGRPGSPGSGREPERPASRGGWWVLTGWARIPP